MIFMLKKIKNQYRIQFGNPVMALSIVIYKALSSRGIR